MKLGAVLCSVHGGRNQDTVLDENNPKLEVSTRNLASGIRNHQKQKHTFLTEVYTLMDTNDSKSFKQNPKSGTETFFKARISFCSQQARRHDNSDVGVSNH